MQKIRKGDKVIVLAGNYKGKTGIVTKVMPKEDKLIVEGVNLVKRHQKQTVKQEAGIITKEAPIHISNVGLIDPSTGESTRVGFIIEDGNKYRVAKVSGKKIDG